MTAFVFKPSRRRKGKLVQSRMYNGRYRRHGEVKLTTVALHVTDKAVAEKKLRQLIRDIEKEEIGIAVPKRVRIAAEAPLNDHIKAYCDDLAGRQRAPEYIATIKARLTKLAKECNWTRFIAVTPESFQAWRAKQNWGPKTLNDYLAAISGLFTWLQKARLVEENPLRFVGKSETRGKERRKRRALTEEQLEAVVAVSGVYRLALLTLYYSALRTGELEQLEWGDVKTSAKGTFVIPRASTTKNRKSKLCRLPGLFARELIESRPQGASEGDRVFTKDRIPSIWAYRTLLKRAGIPYKDDQGKQADRHALRRTTNTHLALNDVDPQVRQEIMRHSDIRLTLDVYTDKQMLPIAEAIEKLPMFRKPVKDAHPCAHNPDVSSRELSRGDNANVVKDASETIQDEERRHALALSDVTEQNWENGCLARIRT